VPYVTTVTYDTTYYSTVTAVHTSYRPATYVSTYYSTYATSYPYLYTITDVSTYSDISVSSVTTSSESSYSTIVTDVSQGKPVVSKSVYTTSVCDSGSGTEKTGGQKGAGGGDTGAEEGIAPSGGEGAVTRGQEGETGAEEGVAPSDQGEGESAADTEGASDNVDEGADSTSDVADVEGEDSSSTPFDETDTSTPVTATTIAVGSGKKKYPTTY
jgi:hypothetical protein